MKITLNGNISDLNEGLSISELIELKKLNPDGVVVELNMEIISKNERASTILKEGDIVEILHFVGGG